jgi:hypothetical protein
VGNPGSTFSFTSGATNLISPAKISPFPHLLLYFSLLRHSLEARDTLSRTMPPSSPSKPVAEENNALPMLNYASESLIRYLQEQPDADKPANPIVPKFHTGKIPNSKTGDGKPRLLLMGQKR